eukprot:1746985-Amphidinium_carterae.1
MQVDKRDDRQPMHMSTCKFAESVDESHAFECLLGSTAVPTLRLLQPTRLMTENCQWFYCNGVAPWKGRPVERLGLRSSLLRRNSIQK